MQPALTLVSGDGVRRFSPMFSVFLHGHGFMLLENREPAEVALLQAVHAELERSGAHLLREAPPTPSVKAPPPIGHFAHILLQQ